MKKIRCSTERCRVREPPRNRRSMYSRTINMDKWEDPTPPFSCNASGKRQRTVPQVTARADFDGIVARCEEAAA
jgi:hypothetical protein